MGEYSEVTTAYDYGSFYDITEAKILMARRCVVRYLINVRS